MEYLKEQFSKVDKKTRDEMIESILELFDDIKYEDLLSEKTERYQVTLLKKFPELKFLTQDLKVTSSDYRESGNHAFVELVIDFKIFKIEVYYNFELNSDSWNEVPVIGISYDNMSDSLYPDNDIVGDDIYNDNKIKKLYDHLKLNVPLSEFNKYILCFLDFGLHYRF